MTTYFGPVEVRNWLGAEQVLTYPQPSIKLTNGVATWLHFDHLGSVRAITDATGAKVESAIYRPFGEQSEWLLPGTPAPETKGWIGERFDADAGLQYLNARYYDPALGLFLQPDWFEVTKPGVGPNRFSYSFNDPVNLSDPGGNCPVCVVVAVIGYFSSVDPANAPGPGDQVLPPNKSGLYVGVVGGTVATTGIKIAATACAGSAGCSAAATSYAAAETTLDAVGCSNGDAASCGAAAIPGVSGVGVHAVDELAQGTKVVAEAVPERVVIKVTSSGDAVVVINGTEMSIHATEQATKRGISNSEIASAMNREPFDYIQKGENLKGYYDPETNFFVGLGDRVTTVMRPTNPDKYLENLKKTVN